MFCSVWEFIYLPIYLKISIIYAYIFMWWLIYIYIVDIKLI